MKLIVGLGNPGDIYKDSRHNIGFLTIRALAKDYAIALKKEKGIACLSGRGKIGAEPVFLAMPLTFMNLSGVAVKALLKRYKIDLDSLLVVCDDLDLEIGRIKIKSSGSSGGHHGLNSIIDLLASDKFCRLRVGIGRPYIARDPAKYVLSRFTKREQAQFKGIIEKASCCCETWVTKGAQQAMNTFNKRSNNDPFD